MRYLARVRVLPLASGSSGNCALVQAGRGVDAVSVCLDCGIPQRAARSLAEQAGGTLTGVDAVLLTHRHSDHAANVVQVAARAAAPLYAHEAALGHNARTTRGERRRRGVRTEPLADRAGFALGPLQVLPVELPHDAEPTFGFVFESAGRRAGFFTDLGRGEVLDEALLDGIDTLVLEFNHDAAMLAGGPYPLVLRQRVGGDLGHLSNAQAEEVLARAAPHGLRRLVLAHLSERNNRPELALEAAHRGLRRRGLGSEVEVLVAPKRGLLPSLLEPLV